MIRNVWKKIKKVQDFIFTNPISKDNRGMGVIEVMLIIVVLVGLVVVFRTNITSIVNTIFNKLTSRVSTF